MNYIELLNNFWRLNKEYSFTPNEKALYFTLLNKCNELHWKNPFNQSSEYLAVDSGMSISAIQKARNILKQLNLIDFKPGNGRRSNTVYKIINVEKGGAKNHLYDTLLATLSATLSDTLLATLSDQKRTNNIKHKIKEEKIINISFGDFWDLYDKKSGNKEKLEAKWAALSDEERLLAMDYIPKYKLSQPDKKFRKNPETFLNNKSWNDEIIGLSDNTTPKYNPSIFEKEY